MVQGRRLSTAIRRTSLTVVFLAVGTVLSTQPAAACSAGEWDRRAATEMFVLGQVVSVEFRPSTFPPSKSSARYFQKVITMKVDLVLKGRPVSTVTFVDAGVATEDTVINTGQRVFSWGGGGDCSAVEEDPRGKYGAFALGRSENGGLYSSVLLGSALGTDARDPAIARLIADHGLSLPSTSTTQGTDLGLAASGLAGLTLLIVSWALRRRSLIGRR